MRHLLLTFAFFAVPLTVAAQTSYSNSPMLVGQDAPAIVNPAPPAPSPTPPAVTSPAAAAVPAASTAPLPPNFPDWAVTKAGENTSGEHVEIPANPPSPAAPTAPGSTSPANPAAPPAPSSPPNPVSKLWPRDTVPIFLQSCVGFHRELLAPCTCVITSLMSQMGHDEFLAKTANDTIEQDQRLIAIREQCVATPRQRE